MDSDIRTGAAAHGAAEQVLLVREAADRHGNQNKAALLLQSEAAHGRECVPLRLTSFNSPLSVL